MKKILTLLIAVCLLTSAVFAGGKKEKVVINSAADLAGKKIGVQAGTTGEMWVEENVEGAKISSFKTGIDAALDLKNGAIDAVVLDELPAKEIVSRNKDLTIVKDNFAREEYAIAVKKGNPELLDSINKTIEKMKANGDYEKLVNAFMPVDGKIVIPADKTDTSASKIVKLGTNAAFPPFEYVEGKDVVGFDISMGQRIAADYGRKLEVVDMAFDSLIPALQSGAIDFIAAGMSVTEERKKNVDFSVPYYESEQVIIIRKK
ncbi:MAG: transporter substrate-binding domain-containing protein [Spirochaetaceae bacterium]|nr:transporter substrate-binding domain-containing protein [Spirochaetaceae bacterium]